VKATPLDALAADVRKWQRLKSDIGKLRATAADLEAKLIAALGDAEVGTVRGKEEVRCIVKEGPHMRRRLVIVPRGSAWEEGRRA
jgi:hypothetical protein